MSAFADEVPAESGLSDGALQNYYDSSFRRQQELQDKYDAAPSKSSLRDSEKRKGDIEIKENLKPQLEQARATAKDALAELNRRKKERAAADKPNPYENVSQSSALTQARLSKNADKAAAILDKAGFDQDFIDTFTSGMSGGGGGGGASGLASQGAMLRAQLQNQVQNRRITLDEAKLVKDTYFDALTEARQRENIAQDALAAGERASAQAMTTERSKMANVVTPQDLALWANATNKLGEVSGSPFRVPEDWVSGHAPVGINPALLGPSGLDIPAQTAGRAVEGWNMTAPQIHERALGQAEPFLGGYSEGDQAIVDLIGQASEMYDEVGVQ